MPRSPGKFVSVGSDGGKVKKAGLFKKSDEKNDQRREGGRAMGMNDLMGTHLQEEAGWSKKKAAGGRDWTVNAGKKNDNSREVIRRLVGKLEPKYRNREDEENRR